MKSLILKDFYNILHNIKSMLFVMIFLAVAFIPSSGVEGYIFICTIIFSEMVITTFSIDERSNWTRYAMIMPLSRKNLVAGKFAVLALFSITGSLIGLIISIIGNLILNQFTLSLPKIGELLLLSCIACIIAIVFGSISIPLVFKFGAEKSRLLMIISYIIPAAIIIGGYQLLHVFGITVTKQIITILLYCIPVIALLFVYLMYRISYHIFLHQEI